MSNMSKTGLQELKDEMSKNGFKYRHTDSIFDRFMHRQLNVYVDHHIKDDTFYITGEFGNLTVNDISEVFYFISRQKRNA